MQPSGFAFTAEQKQKILEVLRQRGAILPCSRCGNPSLSLSDGFFLNNVGDGKSMFLGGPAIPAVVVICVRCGAIYEHAVGTLGLFDEFGFKGTA